jgi:hypothetical protein
MTETAREALLNRKRTGDSSAPQQSARELLAARASGKTFDIPKDASKPEPPAGYSAPYSYFTPEVQRNVGNDGTGASPLAEIPGGFNQGVAHLLGTPMSALADLGNLSSAGMGWVQSKITGEAPSPIFNPVDKASIPFTGDWNERMLNASPLGDVTSVRNPDSATARVIHQTAAGVPGGLVGGGPGIVSGSAGGAGGAIAGELGADPATQSVVSLLSGAAGGAVADRASAPPAPKPSAQDLLNEQASKQSMGAAGSAVDLQKLSPELKSAVEDAVQKTGGAVNPEALTRQLQADSLPVKVSLSEGQALGDPRLISIEMNARGKHDAYSKGFEAQNKALIENMRVLRDSAGENVFSANPVEHGDTLIARYKAIDEAANADIGSKYQELRDAAGGEFPVDTPSLLTNVNAALKKGMASSKAPKDVMDFLQEKAAAGGMTLEEFEDTRSTLARIQRTASDGQERHAAGLIRKQIEEMPLRPEAASLKGIADAARNAARTRFQALEADPAYKAAVEESTPPDRFVQKFVIGGTRDNVAKLSDAMRGDESAAQTLKVATLDHLRQSAGVDSSYNGNFTQAGYNKALRALEPKLGFLLDPKLAEHVNTLGDVARYTQFQPKGSFVNNSNTFVAAAGEKAADALEGILNYKTGGIPLASAVRKQMNENKVRKQAEATFAPGAGLTKLNELMNPEKKK